MHVANVAPFYAEASLAMPLTIVVIVATAAAAAAVVIVVTVAVLLARVVPVFVECCYQCLSGGCVTTV